EDGIRDATVTGVQTCALPISQFKSFANSSLWVILGIALLALVFAAYLRREVLEAPEGTSKMKEIAHAIQEGAKAYLNRQFRTVRSEERRVGKEERARV